MENIYSNLHRKYAVSKTLRFELKPIGKTKENIEKNGLLEEDEYRDEIYKNVKKYCDEVHKNFIDNCMEKFSLDIELLEKYQKLQLEEVNTNEDRKEIKDIQEKLRKSIANRFKKDAYYKSLFNKDMIIKNLPEIYKNEKNKLKEISEFNKFTTYFQGFNQNRENMYVEDEKSTAIAYRLINENLPIFINNVKVFKKIKEVLSAELEIVNKELNDYIQINASDISEIFSLTYFNDVLTQRGIEIYNIIVSGKSEENAKKIKGLNEYINEYNQTHKENRLPKLRQLYKQILSDKVGASFVFDIIDSDIELVENIQAYYTNFRNIMYKENGIKYLIESIDKFDLNKIYINNDLSLTQISNEIFGDWNKINELISDDYDKKYMGKQKIGTVKYDEEKKKVLKARKNYSLEDIEYLIKKEFEDKSIVSYIKAYMNTNNLTENIDRFYEECEETINQNYSDDSRELVKDESAIEKIKNLLDEIKRLQNFVRILIPRDKAIDKDDNFYNNLEELYVELCEIIPLYNKTRNYLTQKPFSTEKIKLNFENPTLLNGWDLNKEQSNLGVLLKKDNNYYLGIINPYNRKIFVDTECDDSEIDFYEKMEYKLLPGPNKMLPKVFFSKSRIEEFAPSDELVYKYDKGYHKKGKEFDLDFCHELIDFFKKSINKHEDWSKFNFEFKDTNEYNDIGEFYKDVEKQGYKISFKNYSSEYINSLVEVGDLYLFQIYNKDFSTYSKGKPNLHTMYWKALFDENNLKDIVYKLNGEAEIFYRKASLKLEDTAVHKKGEKINKKNLNHLEEKSFFEYDLIKDKRYTVDKFQFHVPITINFINEEKNNLNEEVNQYLKYHDVNVIGIDRGERNLLYVTVINPQGEILEQFSLNEIINEYNNEEHKTNYHDLLNKKESEREKARESWKTIENIKELKEGYLSQVIHKLVCLMEKYKAIIVIEDLNNGFKNSRIKVEKQVYQKFEKMLIDKLNFLIFKDNAPQDEGGVLNGYQLTNKFESFNKIRKQKQTGILFYIPAWCTSKIDPTTGFVNLMKIKYESIEKSKKFTNNFEDIRFNESENYFEFDIDYSKFTTRPYGSRKYWTICTFGDRIETFRNPEKNNSWDTMEINLTNRFKELFSEYSIEYNNLKDHILEQNEAEFWKRFLSLLRLTLQMRNSIPNSEEDYLVSPIKNSKGFFYNSKDGIESLPKDADANGAYNIARKGLMLVDQIQESDDLKKVKFKISNQEWLEYVQEKDV